MSAVQVVFDMFPAKARYPVGDLIFEPARVILGDGELSIWKDSVAGPERVYHSVIVSYEGAHTSGFAVQVVEGIVVVTRSGRCGCGSRLRRFDPYEGRGHVQVGI